MNDNICFECKINPGIECAGRKPGEHTRCKSCFEYFMRKENIRNAQHTLSLLHDILLDYRDHKTIAYEKCRKIVNSYKDHDYGFYSFLNEIIN